MPNNGQCLHPHRVYVNPYEPRSWMCPDCGNIGADPLGDKVNGEWCNIGYGWIVAVGAVLFAVALLSIWLFCARGR